MTEFSDRPLVAGTVTGLRAFIVDRDGTLRPPMYSGDAWTAGENVAVCHTLDQVRKSLNIWGIEFAPIVPPHRPATKGCFCGFYAFTDGSNQYASRKYAVEAVIEGYGVATVGTRGFRCEKARIIALVDPAVAWWRRWARSPLGFAIRVLGAVLFLALTWLNITTGHKGWEGQVSIMIAYFGAGSLIGWFGPPPAERRLRRRTRKTRRLYPDVAVYPTVAEAIAAHPLSHGQDDVDECDEDDFRRSA